MLFVPLLRRKLWEKGTGNAGRNRLKRNRTSPQAGRAELRDRVRAPNSRAAVPAPRRPAGRCRGLRPDPSLGHPLLPGPRAGASPAAGAPRWPWRDAAPPQVETELVSPLEGLPSHARCLQFARPQQVATRTGQGFPAPPGAPGAEGGKERGTGICFRLTGWARGQGPRFLRVQTPRALVSRLDARAGPPPAVPGSRGDGRPLTRGAEAARRGLDHWAAAGAARRAGPARPGPLICLYYPRETKPPGTDARAPSSLRKPHHTLTSVPPARSPQTRRAPSRPPAPRPKAPGANAPRPASPEARARPRRRAGGWGGRSWLRTVGAGRENGQREEKLEEEERG